MKIKTKKLPLSDVMKIPVPAHKPPKKPNIVFRTLIRVIGAPDLKAAGFTYEKHDMKDAGSGPCLILMNHSSFIDLEIVSKIFYPRPYSIVCTSDGFIGKEWLMRSVGCIPTNKFVSDLGLIRDIQYALSHEKISVLMYPEASYSFDGCATPLPKSLGRLIKRLHVPVVMIKTSGAFLRDPLYNCLQKRKVSVHADVTCIVGREESEEMSISEIDKALESAFTFDNFRDQLEEKISVSEPFRADGLERILYKCTDCGAEGKTEGCGTKFICHACDKSYTLTEYGQLSADDGETVMPHIPDRYKWERECVRREIENGEYCLDTEVDIGVMRDFRAIYMVGGGKLRHDNSGFTLTDGSGNIIYHQNPQASYSLYADYFWYELGDVICIGDRETLYYCFPKDSSPVAKARLAAEEMYKTAKERICSANVT